MGEKRLVEGTIENSFNFIDMRWVWRSEANEYMLLVLSERGVLFVFDDSFNLH